MIIIERNIVIITLTLTLSTTTVLFRTTKLQKLHLAALSGDEGEVQKLLGKGVGKKSSNTMK